MKSYLYVGFFILLTLIPLANANSSEVLPGAYEIVAVIPSTGGIHIQVTPEPPPCTASWWGTQLIVRKDTQNYNVLAANIMTAFNTQKQLSVIHYNPVMSGNCSNGNELNILAFKINR